MKNLSNLVNSHVMGLVSYQPGKPIETLARELGIDPESIAKMASNESPLGPSPKAVKAMCAAAAEMQLYPDGAALELKEKLSAHYGLPADHFVIGNGSNELIELLGHAFLNEKNALIMSQYAFVVYKLVAKMFCASCEEVPAMPDFGHDVYGLIRAAKQRNARLLFVCNPNNPTGNFLSRRDLERLLNGVPEEVIVVFDEAYAELAHNRRFPETVSLLEKHPNLIILRTFSKAYGLAGLRIGYAIASPELCGVMNRVRQPFNVSRIAQIAACSALDDQGFVQKGVRHYRHAAEQFSAFFHSLNIPYIPTCTNFILAKVGDGQKLFEKLEKQGLITRPMGPYKLPEWLRISFGTETENQRLIDAMSKLLRRRKTE